MMKEQPLVDATLLNLVHMTDNASHGTSQHRQSDGGASTSTASSLNEQKGARTPLTNKVAKFNSNADLMLEKMDELKAVLKEIELDPGKEKHGLPTIERDISAIMSYPPPTWSMLQEAEVIKTCNPPILMSSKALRSKEALKPTPPSPASINLRKIMSIPDKDSAPTLLSLVRQTTSLESFKPRMGLLGSSKPQPFKLATGAGKEPSSGGMDDMMKSPSELKMEQDNRKMWEKRP